jgi:hypothetical protein
MRPIGFSTGSLAHGDFRAALEMLADTTADAVELSALRKVELPELVRAADSLQLDGFRHVSVHAPSAFGTDEEPEVVRMLHQLAARKWPIIAHPDAFHDLELWRGLGAWLWIENMDKRKRIGRTAMELHRLLGELPDARLCVDLAHARQVDPTMLEARRILRAHRDRIRQIHVSEVGTTSRHTRLSYGAIRDFAGVAQWVPADVPVIVESPVSRAEIERELDRAGQCFRSPVLV